MKANQTQKSKQNRVKQGLYALLLLAFVFGLLAAPAQPAIAANPPPVQYYYVALPEDDLLTLFDENQDTLGTYDQVISPIRSVTSIAINEAGTLVYWDQWEDGGYDSDIANPGANVYNASTNPDGTQIWGDGDLTNGCPPLLYSGPNPCAAAADDQFVAGDVIILDNDVNLVTGRFNVLDQFSTVAYNNNNGTNNWSSNWVETGDDGVASTGDILITSNQLRFAQTADANDFIQREVSIPVNGGVTVASFARLKFTLGYSGVTLDGTDEFRVEVSSNGGTSWTTLATFGSAAGNPPSNPSSQSFDIGANIGTTNNTRVRFFQVDALETGNYWYVDDVEIEWGYDRDPAQVFFDGRDKVGATTPVAMSRAAFPPTPGSVMAGGSEMFDTSQWGTSYVAPVGEDTAEPNTSAFEDVRWFIMAGAGGATIDVDANGDGDVVDAGDLNDYVMTEGSRRSLDGINDGATLTVVAGNPVQVNSMTADNDDTFEFRWDALIPRPNWSNDYYTPVGTNPQTDNLGCTEVWVYNPNAAQITINWDRPGGSSYPTADGSFTVSANSAAASPSGTSFLTLGNGARLWSAGGQVFSPFSITDCTKSTAGTDGRLMDWGAPLVPTNQLTSEVLVGWAPGCSNESHSGICHDPDSTAGGTTPDITGNEGSRNVLFVTAVATTNIYIDTNGSGLTCTPGTPTVTGAEKTQTGATALTSYRFNDNATTRNYVHDNFGTQSYARDDSVDGWGGNASWTSDWTETGEGTAANAGAIQINTTSPATLRFQDAGGADETGRTIQRSHNTSGRSFARLSFRLFSSTGLDATDRLAVEVSTNGSTWTTLETFVGPYVQTLPGPNFPVVEVFNISRYIANPTYIRFRIVDNLESGDYWAVDHVHIDYASGGDYDMSGALVKTFNADCSGTPIAVAYGQEPSLTGGNDDEALDLGTLIPPYRPPTVRTGSIGNYVWLDEDGDGDQDAGESGLPNVKVTLTGTSSDGTSYNLTTYTDANGGYIFTGIKPGSSYTVTVDTTTLPAGLAANPTYDENGVGTPSTTTLALAPGEEHLTADFGYNWSSTNETNNNTGTGAIGDRLWIDSDGNGVQDPNEIGLYNVPVQLITAGADGLFGTADDVVAASTTTDHNGNYIFDGLSAGNYIVKVPTPPAGYTQTGDPDGLLDNQTTDPIVLSPGDVFLTADFGYQPTAGTTGSIGDTVWVDSNRNNAKDAGEPGIPGVTVSLIKDLDGDGTWDIGEPIIAVDVTDENGVYGFTGLPVNDGTGTDDYLVWVNDTNNVLGELVPTYDVRDGASQGNPTTGVVTGLEISAVTNLTTAVVDNADFAYAPSGHDSGEGLIGDTIFLDRDGDGAFDPGEGIEGVQVELLDSTGRVVGRTTTNENGQYFFGGLPAGTYTVNVVATTLPNGGTGLTNTVDPDGGTANQSVVTLAAGGINLAQDFGYRPVSPQAINNLSGTLWNDTDADGTLDGGEAGRYQNVTLGLYTDTNGNGVLDGGDALVGTTTTDSNGNYSFNNLPNGTYFVDVIDENNVLDGLWKSNGASPGADNNSQVDPYKVTLSGGQTNTTADFGYYDQPAALGNYVWEDLDADGIQDVGEPPIAGAKVTLTITYPGGAGTTTLTTLTDANGYYEFANLLFDEDFNGTTADGSTEPTFSISVAPIPGYAPTRQNATTENLDSDNPAGEIATVTEGSTNNDYDFGFVRKGEIGNYIWLDENGDGVQDAGEPGIPNVKVTLTGTDLNGNPVNLTTYTDANGGYVFKDILPGSYTVTVDTTTLPAGLAANPTFDEDGTGTPNTSSLVLKPGEEHLTADFGYNWNPTSDVTGNTGTGTIGDRVWVDSDGDGLQDPDEIGLSGITVELFYDPDNNGVYDTLYPGGSTTTDANGNYIFDNLPAGSYVVKVNGGAAPAGYTQTGDPDTTLDSQSRPIALSPGDVFLNADFGYQPLAGTTGSIGDTVWVDANRNGILNAGEPVLPNVTVSLIKDANGNGIWDAGEPIIATDITDANGVYTFSGLPVTDGSGTDDYLVWVNDTNTVLDNLVPTFDKDGAAPASGVVTGLGITAVSGLAPAGLTDVDFAYAPAGHDAGEAIVGDTIFLDRDNNGLPGPGEGLEGVTVRIYDGNGVLLGITTTNENGLYLFGGLPAGNNYTIKVDPTTLPAGVTNTVDPDGGIANQSTFNLTAGQVKLDQDFGYRDTSSPNSLAGTIWKDTDADGSLEGTEPARFAGVTVVLYDANGNIVATTTTDAGGNYSFTNLPDGTYTVDVTDDANLLNGFWHSTGNQDPNVDNQSKADPFQVTVAGGQNLTTVDFGYYRDPAYVGDLVWFDNNNDGIQDVGEPGIPGVKVTLTINYPNGAVVTMTAVTDANGNYRFDNLLLDENFDGVGAGEPTFQLSFTPPSSMVPTGTGQGGDPTKDSNPNNYTITLTEGGSDISIDFGFKSGPTAVTLDSFQGVYQPATGVTITWETMLETNTVGFNLYRTLDPNAELVLLHYQASQVPGENAGAKYQFVDAAVQPGTIYYYWLEEVLVDGTTVQYGPIAVDTYLRIYLPRIGK